MAPHHKCYSMRTQETPGNPRGQDEPQRGNWNAAVQAITYGIGAGRSRKAQGRRDPASGRSAPISHYRPVGLVEVLGGLWAMSSFLNAFVQVLEMSKLLLLLCDVSHRTV
jgi:hypothetical protein